MIIKEYGIIFRVNSQHTLVTGYGVQLVILIWDFAKHKKHNKKTLQNRLPDASGAQYKLFPPPRGGPEKIEFAPTPVPPASSFAPPALAPLAINLYDVIKKASKRDADSLAYARPFRASFFSARA
ncbi:hypothetical protein EVAR_14579_1 [Eumeta japonica]|uniref:Uncharacterized protein n=1 Tax=Eumeta variegata TaxID=151549 RepID=A0A4C1UVP7_EUMVA|nr:hypothetical protein EVAR_14579_1 [Eumeta japonica]